MLLTLVRKCDCIRIIMDLRLGFYEGFLAFCKEEELAMALL